MKSIQVDMFEVQLGRAHFFSFRTPEDQTVCVLADAGVQAKHYKPNHVHKKLDRAFAAFVSGPRAVYVVDKRLRAYIMAMIINVAMIITMAVVILC